MTLSEHNSWAQATGFLRTSASNVWKLLTDPKLTEHYMYNCQLHADWQIGGQAVWKAQDEKGNWIDHVKAQVLLYEPYRHLAFIIMHQATAERPEVKSELHYTLEPKTDGIQLTIKQGNFTDLKQDDELLERCQQGWDFVMPMLIETCHHVFDKPT